MSSPARTAPVPFSDTMDEKNCDFHLCLVQIERPKKKDRRNWVENLAKFEKLGEKVLRRKRAATTG
jgi:hypothetical protein